MNTMVYSWKPKVQIPIPAQVVGERIEQIRIQKGGNLTPSDIVSDARKDNSPLHPCFEWNDPAAAEKYRDDQARYLLRQIVVTIQQEETESFTIRAFVNLKNNNSCSYTSVLTAMGDPEKRLQIVQKAWDELKAWKSRYQEYKELANIFAALESVPERVSA
jgi:hypothetical protein